MAFAAREGEQGIERACTDSRRSRLGKNESREAPTWGAINLFLLVGKWGSHIAVIGMIKDRRKFGEETVVFRRVDWEVTLGGLSLNTV